MAEFLILAASPISFSNMEAWLEYAFYPTLLLIFLIASLGVPIPEDLPLIAAGVLLRVQPGIATWHWTFLVSLVGILSGDMILYSLGRRWGPTLFSHKSVRWLMTPELMGRIEDKFHRQGSWMVFFGRFVVGVRAAMCLTAGVTRFPFMKFFFADCCGAVLSIPLFLGLGFFFAGFIDPVLHYLKQAQWVIFLLVGVPLIAWVGWQVRKYRRKAAARAQASAPELTGIEPRRHEGTKEDFVVGKGNVSPTDPAARR